MFLTGITKFSQLSIFSELNNITNVSMLPEFAAICGITQEELETQLRPDIEMLGQHVGKRGKVLDADETMKLLKYHYDGYHFAWPSPDIYNPFSLMTAFQTKRIKSYWFGSGTPTYLIEMMHKFQVPLTEFGGKWLQEESFDAPTHTMTSITPLLYQSGYITIKDYDDAFEQYLLDIPNQEVRLGLSRSLLPEYVTAGMVDNTNSAMVDVSRLILAGDMDGALQFMQKFLRTIPYTRDASSEGHYQAHALCHLGTVWPVYGRGNPHRRWSHRPGYGYPHHHLYF